MFFMLRYLLIGLLFIMATQAARAGCALPGSGQVQFYSPTPQDNNVLSQPPVWRCLQGLCGWYSGLTPLYPQQLMPPADRLESRRHFNDFWEIGIRP